MFSLSRKIYFLLLLISSPLKLVPNDTSKAIVCHLVADSHEVVFSPFPYKNGSYNESSILGKVNFTGTNVREKEIQKTSSQQLMKRSKNPRRSYYNTEYSTIRSRQSRKKSTKKKLLIVGLFVVITIGMALVAANMSKEKAKLSKQMQKEKKEHEMAQKEMAQKEMAQKELEQDKKKLKEEQEMLDKARKELEEKEKKEPTSPVLDHLNIVFTKMGDVYALETDYLRRCVTNSRQLAIFQKASSAVDNVYTIVDATFHRSDPVKEVLVSLEKLKLLADYAADQIEEANKILKPAEKNLYLPENKDNRYDLLVTLHKRRKDFNTVLTTQLNKFFIKIGECIELMGKKVKDDDIAFEPLRAQLKESMEHTMFLSFINDINQYYSESTHNGENIVVWGNREQYPNNR